MPETETPLPTVAIIAGAWQNPDCYEPLRQSLASRGYDSVSRSPPSTSLPHGDTDLDADIAFVHNSILLPLVDEGKEVVVVMHSFGGVYGGGAVQGLSKAEYSKTGKKGGVIALVYMAAACIPSGVSTLQLMGIGDELLPWVSLDKSTGLLTIPDPIPQMFHNLAADEAKRWAAQMKHQAIKPMQSVVPYAPFEDELYKEHLAYLVCTEDQVFHPPSQKKFVGAAGIQVTDGMPTSHMPFLEMPDVTAEKLLGLVKKVGM